MKKKNVYFVLGVISGLLMIALTANENVMMGNNEAPTEYWIFKLSDIFGLLAFVLLALSSMARVKGDD